MAEEDIVNLGDENFSLAELGEIDLDGVEEVRQFVFPTAACLWRIDSAKLGSMTEADKKVAAIILQLECEQVFAVADDKIDGDTLIGKNHVESIPIKSQEEVLDAYGKIKAFMTDIGFTGTGKLQERLAAMENFKFKGRIKNRPSSKDPDMHFANLGLRFGNWKVAPADSEDFDAKVK